MKFISIIAIAAGLLLFTSCGPEKGESIDKMSGLSQTDSLMYYFGQQRAAEYWRGSARDTVMKTQEARDAYLEGIKSGMDLVKNLSKDNAADDSYNMGVYMGVQLAMNLNEFAKQYGDQPNKQVLLKSIAYGLSSDTTVNEMEAQEKFYSIMTELNVKKEAADKQAAAASLETEVKNLGMEKVADNLYGKVTKNSAGAQITTDDKVTVDIAVKKVNGEPLEIPFPEQIDLNSQNVIGVFKDAILKLHVGETGEFATSAYEIFGQQAHQLGLEPNDVLLITINALSSEKNGEAAEPKPGEPAVHPEKIDRDSAPVVKR